MSRALKPSAFYQLQASEHGIYRLLNRNDLTQWEEKKLRELAESLEKLYLRIEKRINGGGRNENQ